MTDYWTHFAARLSLASAEQAEMAQGLYFALVADLERRAQRWRHGPFVTKLIGYDTGPAGARRIGNAAGKWAPRHCYPTRLPSGVGPARIANR